MNKKGNVFDVVTTFKLLGVFGFVILIMAVILKNFASNISSLMPTIVVAKVLPLMENYATYWDWASLAIYIALIVISVIFARLIQSNVMFLVIAFIATPLIGVFLMVLGNIMETMLTSAAFSSVVTDMPITYFMWTGATPLILGIIYMIIVFIALYAGKNE